VNLKMYINSKQTKIHTKYFEDLALTM